MKTSDYGFLLFKTNYSESSLMLTFYTQKSGISNFIYKGAKKKSVPFFVFGHYEIASYKRPESDLGMINSLAIATPYLSSASHPAKMLISFFVSDVLRQTLKEEQADQVMFSFLLSAAQELNETNRLKEFPLEFAVKLTINLGFAPQTIPNATAFNLKTGRFSLDNGDGEYMRNGPMANFLNVLFSTFVAPHSDIQKQALGDILLYMRIHLPSFDNTRSLSIIREVLYS
jgi:DNA repair protein RecO (recombination protein O)